MACTFTAAVRRLPESHGFEWQGPIVSSALSWKAQDDSVRLAAAVQESVAQGRSLTLLGSGSKRRRFPNLVPSGGASLSTAEHVGVLYYAPDELVIEARAGTRLAQLNEVLVEHRQQLAFEPPEFDSGGTLGGAVASGLAGPARPWGGAVRDAMLGVELLNGRAERLRFGGRVVKNVAGFDVARLQAGAFGTLGCLLSVALRVMPMPAATADLELAAELGEALDHLGRWHRASLPLTASCWETGRLHLRLAGPARAVASAAARIRADSRARSFNEPHFWRSLRDQNHPFFRGSESAGPALSAAPGATLYRASVPLGTPPLPIAARTLIEWRGAQRWHWLQPDQVASTSAAVSAAGGYLAPAAEPCLMIPEQPVLNQLQLRLRQAFDPTGCFNRHLVADHAH